MSLATAMYHSGRNPLKKVTYKSEKLYVPREYEQRRTQKALLRYHDEDNWDRLRTVLTDMGRDDLIGTADWQLVPAAEKKIGYKYVQKSKQIDIKANSETQTAATNTQANKPKSAGGKVIARAAATARKKSSGKSKSSTRKKSIKRS
jgi:hypothetical protein